jgi:hypothetical protein
MPPWVTRTTTQESTVLRMMPSKERGMACYVTCHITLFGLLSSSDVVRYCALLLRVGVCERAPYGV